jgi:hypothetical protein
MNITGENPVYENELITLNIGKVRGMSLCGCFVCVMNSSQALMRDLMRMTTV